MGVDTTIVQNGNRVRVTSSGELVTSALAYDLTKYKEMSSTGVPYNFFLPQSGKQFIITGFLAVSDKNITADAIVTIYESDSDSSTTILKELPKFAMTKNAVVSPTPLRILVNSGVWLNASTDDATIHLTMFGYYIDIVN